MFLRLAESGDPRDVALGVVFRFEESLCVIEAPVVELFDGAGNAVRLTDVGEPDPGSGTTRIEGVGPDAVELTIVDAISTCEDTDALADKVRLSTEAGVLAEIFWAPSISLCATEFRAGGAAEFREAGDLVVEGPLVRQGADISYDGSDEETSLEGLDGATLAVTGGCVTVDGFPTVFARDARWNAESNSVHLRSGGVLPMGTEVTGVLGNLSPEQAGLPASAIELWAGCGLSIEEIWFVDLRLPAP